jgi:hypothetical protein
MIPTRQQVEDLKANWRNDPCWDIYNTEGFEEYEDELRQYQAEQEARWREERLVKLQTFAERIGANSLALAEYLQMTERLIDGLEARISKLEGRD